MGKHSTVDGKPAKRLKARIAKFDSEREQTGKKPGSLKK